MVKQAGLIIGALLCAGGAPSADTLLVGYDAAHVHVLKGSRALGAFHDAALEAQQADVGTEPEAACAVGDVENLGPVPGGCSRVDVVETV